MRAGARRFAALLLACALAPGFAPKALAAFADSGGLAGPGPCLVLPVGDSGEPGPAGPAPDGLPNAVLPPGFDPGDGENAVPPDPTAIVNTRADYQGKLILLPWGEAPALPKAVFGTTETSDLVECPVTWDTSGLQGAGPGRFLVPGTFAVPEGYRLADGFEPLVDPYPLFFYREGMAPEELASIDILCPNAPEDDTAYRLGTGGDVTALPFWEAQALCGTAMWEEFPLPVRWDTGALRPDLPGRYQLAAQFTLPPGFSPPRGYAPFTVTVEVGDPQPVWLESPRLDGENVICGLAKPIGDPGEIRAQYRRPETSWWSCGGDLQEDGKVRGGNVVYDGRSFTVLTGELIPGQDYSFRLRYQGVVSNELHVRVPPGGGPPEFSLDGGLNTEPPPDDGGDDPTGGDRGGGDREEQELPALRQEAEAAPEPAQPVAAPGQSTAPEANPPASPLPFEESTATGTTLSGARLAQLIEANQGAVLIEKQGIAVELPAEFLRSLQIEDRSLLAVTVRPAGESGFLLAIDAQGSPVGELPPTLVRLPLKSAPREGALLACYDASGAFVCDAAWDPVLGVAAVTVTRTGEYQIREKEAALPALAPPAAGPAVPPSAVQPGPRVPPLALAVIPAAAAGLLLAYQRSKRKGGQSDG